MATLVGGLGRKSRIYKSEIPPDEILLMAIISDQLSALNYRLFGGENPPQSLFKTLTGEKEKPEEGFETAEEYEKMWKKIGGGEHGEK